MPRISIEEIEELCEQALPWVALLGFEVEEIGEGTCRVRLPPRAEFLRPGGTVSGPALMSLAGSASLALRTTIRGRQDLEMWAAVQRKGDSLVALGAGNITAGSDVVGGRPISWTVGAWTAGGLYPQRIDLIVDRAAMVDLSIVKDTIVLYLSN